MGGGTLSLFIKILFYLCRMTYLGHLTKRVRSLSGRTVPPILKFLGEFLKRGLSFFFGFSAFLDLFFLPLA